MTPELIISFPGTRCQDEEGREWLMLYLPGPLAKTKEALLAWSFHLTPLLNTRFFLFSKNETGEFISTATIDPPYPMLTHPPEEMDWHRTELRFSDPPNPR
jgi:hypothetical protein